MRWHLDSDASMATFLEVVTGMRLAGETPVVQFVPEHRTLSQNDLIYALYGEVAKQSGDPVHEVRQFCKLHFGVPILRAEDGEFRALYDKAIKYSLIYEEKLAAMEILPVTSRMSKEQASRYIDAVVHHYTEQGVALAWPLD